MSDILYPLALRNDMAVIAKKDTCVVGINTSGIALQPLMALKQIEITTSGDINRISSVTPYPQKQYPPEKRPAAKRELQEVQNAQLALELERTLEPLIRSFPFSEIADIFLPARMLADVLKHHADYDLPEPDFPAIAAALVIHSDHLIREKLEDCGIPLPAIEMTIDATSSANLSVPAARLVMDWLHKTLDGFAGTVSRMALNRADELRN